MLSSFTHTGMPLYPDLLTLASHINPAPPPLPPHLTLITSPLTAQLRCQLWLDYHPVTYYTASPTACFDHTNTALRSASTSAIEHPEIITKSLLAETGAQRLVGPLNPTLYPYVQTTAWRYKHSETWRLILDLSHPKSHSINDGISRQLCSLTYTKVDYIIPRIILSGRDTLLAKIDIENAFRNVPRFTLMTAIC